jgi:hypothetical protein
MNEQTVYHQERARVELDLSYRAEHRAAAAAHLRLAGLHLQRARASADEVADIFVGPRPTHHAGTM